MRIIVPCAGRSSRFPDMPPKWMLPDRDGLPMVYRAVAGLGVPADDLIFTILREQDERFGAREGLRAAFGREMNCVVLDEPTRSQSETVVQTIRYAGVEGPFMVKDSDNYFETGRLPTNANYVCVASLSAFSQINPQNKSYVLVDQEDVIVNFREKQVISDLFSVGGYCFANTSDFLSAYDALTAQVPLSAGELYISEIISYLAMNGHVFRIKRIEKYQDWGTVHEWRDYLKKHRVFFVSIDGFLLEQGSPYFKPRFEDVKPHPIALEAVRTLIAENQTIIYLSIRAPELEALTRKQLADLGLPDGPIQFGCDLAQWVLLTSPHPSQPFETGRSIECAPDDPNMIEKLRIG